VVTANGNPALIILLKMGAAGAPPQLNSRFKVNQALAPFEPGTFKLVEAVAIADKIYKKDLEDAHEQPAAA
jgi:hypothetical protein